MEVDLEPFPTLSPEKMDHYVVIGGLGSGTSLPRLRRMLMYFGRVSGLWVHATIGFIEYTAKTSVKRIMGHCKEKKLALGENVFFVERYTQIRKTQIDYDIEKQRQGLLEKLIAWQGFTPTLESYTIFEEKGDEKAKESSEDSSESEDSDNGGLTLMEIDAKKILARKKKKKRKEEMKLNISLHLHMTRTSQKTRLNRVLNPVTRNHILFETCKRRARLYKKSKILYSLIHTFAGKEIDEIKKNATRGLRWPHAPCPFPPIHENKEEIKEKKTAVTSILRDLSFDTNADGATDNFQIALKEMVMKNLRFLSNQSSNDSFDHISSNSAAVNIITSLLDEQVHSLMETALRLSIGARKDKSKKFAMGWNSVLKAGTLVGTPARIIRRAKFRLLMSDNPFMRSADYLDYPWRIFVFDALQESTDVENTIPQRPIDEVVDDFEKATLPKSEDHSMKEKEKESENGIEESEDEEMVHPDKEGMGEEEMGEGEIEEEEIPVTPRPSTAMKTPHKIGIKKPRVGGAPIIAFSSSSSESDDSSDTSDSDSEDDPMVIDAEKPNKQD